MAEIAFPATAGITGLSIEPWHPGQIAHESPFTGSVQVLDRGHASWRGSVEFAPTSDDAQGAAIEAFFASLAGQANWCALPLHRGRLDPAGGAVATVTAIVNQADGTVAHETAVDGTFQVGDWLTAQSTRARVFTVRAVSGTAVTLDPQIPLKVGDPLRAAATIRARSRSARVRPLRRTPDLWGPWHWEWQEAL